MIDYIPVKTILSSYQKQGWFGSNYTMNLYRGCSHGCIYCDSRSECYRVEQFDKVQPKQDALLLLEHELQTKRKKGIVISGSMSDTYNPLEKTLQLTRGSLSLLDRYGYGVVIDTKSSLVSRDLDLLQRIGMHAPAIVNVTVTTADSQLCRKLEPYVCDSMARFRAIKQLTDAGIRCGILLMPLLPWINDHWENVKAIIEYAKEAGASYIYPGFGVTLRQNQRVHYYKKLDQLFPGLSHHYQQYFQDTYCCDSPNARSLMKQFQRYCDELHLMYRMQDISAWIVAPYQEKQLTLF